MVRALDIFLSDVTLDTYYNGLPVLLAQGGASICVGSDLASKVLGGMG